MFCILCGDIYIEFFLIRGDEFSLSPYLLGLYNKAWWEVGLTCRILLYYLSEVQYFEGSNWGGIIYFSRMLDFALPPISLFS